MNTKNTLKVTILCVLTSFLLNAQHNCTETLSLFAENVKTKRFAEASPQLEELRKNCATFNYAMYAYGEKVLNHKLKEASDKKKAASELIQLLNERLTNFPEKTKKGVFLPKIGALMLKYTIGTLSEQFQLFDTAFTEDTTHFKNPLNLYHYFELYHKMYQAKTHGISLEQLLEKYEIIKEKLVLEKEQSPKNAKAINTFVNNMNVLIEKEANCETLIPMFQKKLSTHKNDLDWLRKAAGQLDAKGCKDDALFIELVEAIDATEPNANSKFYLYKIHERKDNSAKAKTYLEAYLKLEMDGVKKATVLVKEGRKAAKANQKSKAHMYFRKATNANPTSGDPHLGLARLYAASANACGTDSFTKRAIYWKAADTARKALQIDASVKSEANKLIASYMQLAPSRQDVFNKGYKGGEKIELKCWVGGYVIVPKL